MFPLTKVFPVDSGISHLQKVPGRQEGSYRALFSAGVQNLPVKPRETAIETVLGEVFNA
jgi:hypothetical protein